MPLEHNRIFRFQNYELDLCTVIKNKKEKPIFVLIPWHGTTIGPAGSGDTVTMAGDLSAWLQRKRYYTRRSFTSALNRGDIEIVRTPLPHYTANNVVKVVAVNYSEGNYSPVAIDPSWKPK
jgi:hypothetical protein